jgi:multiple sugar transport system substrate-binding protein
MNKAIKKIAFILCCVMIFTTLAGCGANEAKETKKDSDGKDEKIELNYAFWNKDQEPIFRELADKFEEEHPNVKVNIEVIPYDQYLTKLEVAAQGGTAPDLFWMNGPNFIKYAESEVLKPLNSMIEDDDYDMSVYPESLIDLYTYEDSSYGMPLTWDTIGLYYNKEMFDEAGIDYPDETWDWDKLEEVAGQLTDEDKGIWGIAATCTDQQGFYNTIFQNNGYVVSEDKTESGYDKPEAIKGIKCWVDLIEKGYSPTYEQMTDTKAEDLFASGKVAMMYAGSWMAIKFNNSETIAGKYDVEILPKMENRATVIHGVSNVMYEGTKHPKEAWELMKFFSSKEAGEVLAKEFLLPAHEEALPVYYEADPELNLEAFTKQVEYSYMYPTSLDTMKWLKLQQEYTAKAWSGEMEVEEACKELAEKMNEVLKNEK